MGKAVKRFAFFLVVVMLLVLGQCAAQVAPYAGAALKIASCASTATFECISDVASAVGKAFSYKAPPLEACTDLSDTKRLAIDKAIDPNATREEAEGQASDDPRVRLTLDMTTGFMTNFGQDPNRPGEFGVSGGMPGVRPFKDLNEEQVANIATSIAALAKEYEAQVEGSNPNDWSNAPADEAVRIMSTVYADHVGFAQRVANPSVEQKLKVYEQSLETFKRNGWSTDFAGYKPPSPDESADQLAQHLFVGVSDPEVAKQIIAGGYDIGGLFAASGSDGRVSQALLDALPGLQASAKTKMLIATDQEFTSTVNSLGLADGLKATDLASKSDAEVEELARNIAGSAKSKGFNMLFAPVADLEIDGNAIISKYFRGISSDPDVVTQKVQAILNGFSQAQMIGTVKHALGHGRSNGDSHVTLPTTPPIEELEKADTKPFKAVAGDKNVAFMVGHLNVPGLTDGQPASTNAAAYQYIRNTLGFKGLTITDELGGMVGAGNGPVETRVANALRATADMALFNVTSYDDFVRIYDSVKSNVGSVDDKAVLAAKQSFGLPVTLTSGTGTANTSPTTGLGTGNLDPNKVPEPFRTIWLQAAAAEGLDPNGWGPAIMAGIHLDENNGFPWATREIDGGEGEAAYASITKDSPEWRLDTYKKYNGIWPANNGNFQGPGQFDIRPGRAWDSFGRDGDGDGKKDVYSFVDTAYAKAAYVKYLTEELGGSVSNFDDLVKASRSYNGQGDFYGGIVNPGGRFNQIQDLYAYQVGQIAKAIVGGDKDGQAVVDSCVNEQQSTALVAFGQGTGTTGAFPLQTTKVDVDAGNPGCFTDGPKACRAGHPYAAYDIIVPEHTPVVNLYDGVVVYDGNDLYGHMLSVYSPSLEVTVSYLHMSQLSENRPVKGDATVSAGEVLGYVGTASEGSTVSHLHIDAASGNSRPGCSRANCPASNQAIFEAGDQKIGLGKLLKDGFDKLP